MSTTSLEQAAAAAAVTGQRRGFAIGGLTAVVLGAVAMLALHLVPPTSALSPFRRTISEYAYSSLGWVFHTSVLLIAGGSLLILAAFGRERSGNRITVGAIALIAWSVALVVLVIFPKHDWSVGPSAHGTIHRIASLTAFFAMPVAAVALARRRRGAHTLTARLSIVFGAISAGWLSLILGGFLLGPLIDRPWYRVFPLGFMERGIAAFGVAALICLGVLALRTARLSNSQPTAVGGRERTSE